jgi:hypothetical protein
MKPGQCSPGTTVTQLGHARRPGNGDRAVDRRLAASAYLTIPVGDLRRRAEGLAAAQEAARLYRELAVEKPDVFGPPAENVQNFMSALGEDTP